jgi:hypothetical protein
MKEMNIFSIKIKIKYDGYHALSCGFTKPHNYADPMTMKTLLKVEIHFKSAHSMQ